jgi:ribosomal protein S4
MFKVKENESTTLPNVLAKFGRAKSLSEARRLVAQGAVKVNGEVITDASFNLPKGETTLTVGVKNPDVIDVEVPE